MKYIKVMGLCLAAVLMASAVVAGTAFAEKPIFLFKEGGSKPNFSSKGSFSKFQTEAGLSVSCESDTIAGEAVPGTDHARHVTIVFSECDTKFRDERINCSSPGEPAEVIKTFPLEGQLGYVDEAEKRAGLLLKAEISKEGNPSTLFAEFSCGPVKVKVRGLEDPEGSKEYAGVVAEIFPEYLNKLIDKGSPIVLPYTAKAMEPWVQFQNELKVLGTNITKLLLTVNITGGEGYELAAYEANKHVEIFFLESVEIPA
jgi:hypothetical protein